MKPRSFALPFVPGEADRHTPPPAHVSEAPPPRRTYLRLSPIAAMIVAAAALTLCFERANDRLGLQFGKQTAVSPAEAVDISLQRLGRSRVVARLQRANRLTARPRGTGRPLTASWAEFVRTLYTQ